MPSVNTAAPQFLVDELSEALEFYQKQLGFNLDFVYEDFYASVSRDGATLHLKCAPKLEAQRAHQRSAEHLDAYFDVEGVAQLFEEFTERGVHIIRQLEGRPWGRREFHVEDPDGYILCFSEAA